MLVGDSTDDQWEIQRDCETLMRAKEIVEDPKRLEKAQAFFTKQTEAMKALSDTDFLKKIGFRN
jgi:hypothetical protein